MSALKRFFVDKIEEVVELVGEEFEHAKNVLRLSNGDEVILLDNSGKEYTAVLLAAPVDKSGVTLRRHALESLASSISSLEKITYQYGGNNSVAKQYSINASIANGIQTSVSDAYSSSTTHTT